VRVVMHEVGLDVGPGRGNPGARRLVQHCGGGSDTMACAATRATCSPVNVRPSMVTVISKSLPYGIQRPEVG